MNRSVFMFTFLFKNSSFPENSPVVQWLDSALSLQSSLGSILVEELRFSQAVQPKKKVHLSKAWTLYSFQDTSVPAPPLQIHTHTKYIYIYTHICVYNVCVYTYVCTCVLIYVHVCVCVCSVTKSLCDPKDCGPPGSSVHGISQARILE